MSLTDLSTPPRPNWVKAGLGQAALKSAIAAALAMGVLGAGQAQALVVTVNGQRWNVTTFTGLYANNVSKFNNSLMPWWGAQGQVATDFAVAVKLALGTPNDNSAYFDASDPDNAPYDPTQFFTPFFARSSTTLLGTVGMQTASYGCTTNGGPISNCGINSYVINTIVGDTNYAIYSPPPGGSVWAQATPFNDNVTVPGPLPVFGAAAAFGFSRTMRKRIKTSKAVGASATSG